MSDAPDDISKPDGDAEAERSDDRDSRPNGADEPAGAPPVAWAPSLDDAIGLEMVAPTYWTRGLVLLTLGLAGGGVWLLSSVAEAMGLALTSPTMLPWLGGLAALVVAILVWRRVRLPAEPRVVELGADGVRLPRSPNSTATIEAGYDELRSVLLVARSGTPAVLIDAGRATVAYSEDVFAWPEAPRALRAELLRRIRRQPDGPARLADMEERLETSRQAMGVDPTLTRALIVVIAAVYVVQEVMGATGADGQGALIDLGANVPMLVEQGQWWRLVSANFLHANLIHIGFNGVALLFLGTAIEKLIGSWRYALVYAAGAIGGSLASMYFGPGFLSVGSSTAIFGLFGAFGVLHLRFHDELAPPFRQTLRWWIIIIGLNAALPLLLPVIDWAAHLGGMAAGGLAALAVLAPMRHLEPGRRAGVAVRAIAVAALAVTLFAGAKAVAWAMGDVDGRELMVDAMVARIDEDPAVAEQLNMFAWQTATEDAPTAAELAQARRMIETASKAQPTRHDYRDTRALVLYRQSLRASGDAATALLREAIGHERLALEYALAGEPPGAPPGFYASQLARFLMDWRRERPAITADVPAVETDYARGRGGQVRLAKAAHEPVAVYALVARDRTLLGLARVCFEPGQTQKGVPARQGLMTAERLAVGMITTVDACGDDAVEQWTMEPPAFGD